MSIEANRALGRGFFEAQDRLRGGPDAELCTPDYKAHIGSLPPMTFADHQAFSAAFYAGFPDLQHSIEETFADESHAVVRFTLRGTHKQEFMGMPATNKTFAAGAIAIFHIVDGRIAGLRGQFDQLGMLKQLGAIP